MRPKEKTTVSDYIRGSLLMEMVLDGEMQALKIVATTIGRKAVKALQKRAEQLQALGEPETESNNRRPWPLPLQT